MASNNDPDKRRGGRPRPKTRKVAKEPHTPAAGASLPAAAPGAVPGPPPKSTASRRFVVSQMLSTHPNDQARLEAAERFRSRLESVLLPAVSLVSASASATATAGEPPSRVWTFEADASDLVAIGRELTPDTVIEPSYPVVPARPIRQNCCKSA
jgi:hypothetical protein